MAKPEAGTDGSVNLMVWHCTIPGKAGVSSRHFPDKIKENRRKIWSKVLIFCLLIKRRIRAEMELCYYSMRFLFL